MILTATGSCCSPVVPDVFEAVAHPVRRQLLDLLRAGPQPVHQLAAGFTISRPAVSQHLKILREAHLIVQTRSGRENHYALDARSLVEVQQWVTSYEVFWRDRLHALHLLLDERDEEDMRERDRD